MRGFPWGWGSCSGGNGSPKVPESPPHPRADLGDILPFLLTSWPWAASLGSLSFLLPYTCHLSHPRLIGLPEFTFSTSPCSPRHVASIKAEKQTWKNTQHYISRPDS